MPGTPSLRTVRIQLDPTELDLNWLEGELVRRGARDAHATSDGQMTIVVARPDAERLLDYVACGLPCERRRTNQTTAKTITATARIANAIQPQSVVSS